MPRVAALAPLAWFLACLPGLAAAGKVDFDRDIHPILSDKCFKCHGPDAHERQADLRLDLRDAALRPAESGQPAIVPGNASASALVARVLSTDPEQQMPPPDSNKKLSDAQKQLLKAWVRAGARHMPNTGRSCHAPGPIRRKRSTRTGRPAPLIALSWPRLEAAGNSSLHPRPSGRR